MKKAAMLAMVAAALAALAIPASASAIWQHSIGGAAHQELKEDKQIQITGQAGFVSGSLGTHCLADSKVTLLAGQTTATVTSFEPDLTAPGSTVTQVCEPSPGLKALGCTDVHNVTSEGLPWHAEAVDTHIIEVAFGGVQNHLSGGIFCPKTTQITPGTVFLEATETTFHQGHLFGELETHNPALDVEITGTGTVTPANTYGVA